MSYCPLDDNLIVNKKNCQRCEYFGYDESDDEGKMTIRYFCTYEIAIEDEK